MIRARGSGYARVTLPNDPIERRYAEFEITGPAEIRDVDPDARAFTPHAPFASMMSAELRRYNERPSELKPAIDADEAFLARLFLRRYVTYCASRGQYAAMNEAARLFAEARLPT
jgi:hypothetical protein